MDLNALKDPSKLGNTAKFFAMVAVFITTIGAGVVLDTQGQQESLAKLQEQETTLRATFLDKKKQAVNLPAHREQLKEIELAFGALLRQLPNRQQMDELLQDINQSGVGRGLSFDLFKPAQVESVTDFYAEQPVTISVSGTYSEFGQFVEDVSRLSRIVNMDEISIKSKMPPDQIFAGAPPQLALDAVVRTYRYLEPKELEARKAAANKNKKVPAAPKPAAK